MVVIVDTQEISSIEKPLNVKEETMESSTLNDESRPAKEMSGHTNCNNNGRVSEDSESVSQYTERAIAQFHQGSQLECTTVPDVSPSDVQDGPTIGEGGFAIVTAVEYEGRSCAKKALRQDIIRGTPQTYHIAAADLWKEAEFLSALKHPNIISLRAKHLSLEKMEENFIVIERLEQTLQQQIASWREKDQQVRKSPKMRLQLLQERLRVCKDICETFRFLHEHHIIYRDLKADNLGFDHEGKVQLFGKFVSCGFNRLCLLVG
jgi:Protein kinase domain